MGERLTRSGAGNYDVARLRRWRQLADSHGWKIVVTEAGPYPFGLTRQQIADKVPQLLPVLLQELQPTHVFWFALSVDSVLGEWEKMALVDSTGQQTPVGAAWERYTVPSH